MLCHFSRVQLSATPLTAAGQAPLSVGFSTQERWSGWPCPPPGDLPNQGWNLCLLNYRWILYRWVTGKPTLRDTWHYSGIFTSSYFLVTFKKQCWNITSICGFTSCFFVELVFWACFHIKENFIFFNYFNFLAILCGIQDLSSLTREQICALCIGSLGLSALDCHWSPRKITIIFFPENYFLNTSFTKFHLFIFWLCHVACEISAPCPRIEPRPW